MPKRPASRLRQRKINPLSDHLVLNGYLIHLFGKSSFKEFQPLLGGVKEGFDEEGHSHVFYALISQKDLKIPIGKLEKYDSNLKSYVDHINQRRDKPIIPKYFQHLALLFTETFLDRYFEDPVKLLNELNDYAADLENNEIFFARDDLTKLAFWMATGSGKTPLMHINYLQFMCYNKGHHKIKLDNIILVTPNEGLSNQHIEEMRLSSIPCGLFDNAGKGIFSSFVEPNQVQVIDIYKLTDEKKGQGVTVDVEYFGSANLVFVDEGHKGSGGEKWRRFREFVAEEGFTFEYSATFGQAVAAAARDTEALIEEYGKAILFDYSYKYFYNDGYGKDYRILNLKENVTDTSQDMLMLANLISFYEQVLVFEDNLETFAEYNIEKPLWIFVGSKVKGQKEQSDIRTIVFLLAKVLKNEGNWTIGSIQRILEGKSGLIDKNDRDIFSPTYPDTKLRYIRELGLSPDEIYRGILLNVFNAPTSATLHLVNLKKAQGEIALRSGTSEFFGVINIGDDAEFLKLIRDNEKAIPVESDEMSSSLFASINRPNSRVNILIGAKKFIEGWNSWRVSNMGLLNIGKKEGSQIIQLFGRGVRLRGKGFSLKRSSALMDDSPPEYLKILETLGIFGIKANYMDQFREYLENEGVRTENYIPIEVPIEINEVYLKRGLLITHVEKEKFKQEQLFHLEANKMIEASIDLTPKVDIIVSQKNVLESDPSDNPSREIDRKYLDIIDWNKIYFALLDYRKSKGWSNLLFTKDVLKDIIKRELYTLYCPVAYIEPQKFEDIGRLEEIIENILKRYIQKFYDYNKNHWIQDNMNVKSLDCDNGNLTFEKYLVNVKEDEPWAISEVESIAESRSENNQATYIKNVYFDRHLYQPLLTKCHIQSDKLNIQPQGLNDGERQFIWDLKSHIENHSSNFHDKEIFILRNLPRIGIGFFETSYFYPDFIMWINHGEKQNIIFVDPKGLVHMNCNIFDEKIQLHQQIKELEKRLSGKTGAQKVILDSFIVSVTSYQEIRDAFGWRTRGELESKYGILFQEDDHYIEKMMNIILNN